MSAEFCYTDNPEYILHKEYTEKPDVEKLYEVFIVVYTVEVPAWESKSPEDEVRYIFFKSLEKAMRRWKLFGPRGSMLKRVFTDSDELNEMALKTENIVVAPEEEEEAPKEEEEAPKEEEKKELVV
jgi:hypothetical protein